MKILWDIISLLLLFIVLGISADFIVMNVKRIASTLKIKLFTLGILLGVITTLPELSVGINATMEKAAAISVGNILGGVIILLCLILGISLTLNGKTSTDGKIKTILPQTAILLSPILLGIDGTYSLIDGIIMIGLYAGFIFYVHKKHQEDKPENTKKPETKKIIKASFIILVGVVFLLLSSGMIVDTTLDLLSKTNISKLFIGMIVFSIGTNLPEITITITSWFKKTGELSLSHLLSSAVTNIFVLGILSTISPIVFNNTTSFITVSVFIVIALGCFVNFYKSDKKMDRKEGLLLLSIYILFLIVNIFWSH